MVQVRQPIPPNAKRVFQGIIFDVYQWEQALYNGETAIFEKLTRPETVAVLPVTDDGQILLIEEEQPGKSSCWSAPGGRVELGETNEAAVLRELLEETGYQPETLELWFAVQPVTKIDWTISMFIARGCRQVSAPQLDGGEKIEIRSVNLESFMELVCTDQYYDPELKIRFLEAKLEPDLMARLIERFQPVGRK